MSQRCVVILLFDDCEVLDFCGPLEVFSVAAKQTDAPPWRVVTTAQKQPVNARNGLTVIPDCLLDHCPQPDVLLVPGGIGTRAELSNRRLLEWIEQSSKGAELTLSVCTGALLLGAVDLLKNLEATTHHVAFDLLREISPTTIVHEDRRFVDCGSIVTSAGIAAGIDMSLHVVQRLLGETVTEQTARYMEYPWNG